MLQGRRDFAFGIEQAVNAYARLRGPKRLYIGDLGHAPATNPPAESAFYHGRGALWFDRFLKGDPERHRPRRRPIELAPDPWTGKHGEVLGVAGAHVTSGSPSAGAATIAAGGKVVRTRASCRAAGSSSSARRVVTARPPRARPAGRTSSPC